MNAPSLLEAGTRIQSENAIDDHGLVYRLSTSVGADQKNGYAPDTASIDDGLTTIMARLRRSLMVIARRNADGWKEQIVAVAEA